MKNLILLFSICIFFTNCSKDDCSDKLSFEIDYHLFQKTNNYCYLLNNSFNNNRESIRTFSTLSFFDFASYQHGAALLELIDKIGEEKYISYIYDFNINQKNKVKNNLNAGLEFSENNKFYKKDIIEVYPKLFMFLNKE